MMSALLLIPEIEDGPHEPYQPTELPFSAVDLPLSFSSTEI
jgi:hypothetical protein